MANIFDYSLELRIELKWTDYSEEDKFLLKLYITHNMMKSPYPVFIFLENVVFGLGLDRMQSHVGL